MAPQDRPDGTARISATEWSESDGIVTVPRAWQCNCDLQTARLSARPRAAAPERAASVGLLVALALAAGAPAGPGGSPRAPYYYGPQ